MTPERWRQVKRLLESALERGPRDRAALLDEACKGDPSLRREVESLIASHEQAGSSFDSPAFEAAVSLLADEHNNLVGRHLGHFKILSRIGRGGMGEVYLAQDSRLGRRVALKLLPAIYTRDEDRLSRFALEARSASALNHPNIVTIFDVGEVERVHFIATEYVEGETIRSAINRGGISLLEMLDIGAQASSALAAAHAAGIIHRDIKPENIMLRPDRYVKVLDFGLAKLTERPIITETAPTVRRVETDPGTVLGTAYYMSPEQARGITVDARTDIFSLGIVLYEMITGCLPFDGQTTSDVVASILKTDPEPLATHAPDVPQELQRIVSKSLRKDREERYQTAKDLMVDLRSLRQELELEAKAQQRTSPSADRKSAAGLGTGATLTVETADALERRTSSAEIIIAEIKRHRKGVAIALSIAAVIIAGILYWVYTLVGRQKPATPFQAMKITRLTSSGNATEAAISPDGKYVFYVIQEAGKQSLWLKQAATGSNVQIGAPAEGLSYRAPSFSRDGNYIYYLRIERNEPRGTLYQMPVLGGEPKKLLVEVSIQDTGSSYSFSPDGKQLALIRLNAAFNRSLVVLNPDGTGERELASRSLPNYLAGAAWSPDGRIVACVEGSFSGATSGGYKSFLEVRVEDGNQKPISTQKWGRVLAFSWLPDMSGLVAAAVENVGTSQLWHVPYSGGIAQRITNDLNGYEGVSLTSDGKAVATAWTDYSSSIWIAPAGDTSRAKKVTSSSGDYKELSWTPDAKIVYQSAESGISDIWIINSDGSGRRQLTSDGSSYQFPISSPDGRYIISTASRGKQTIQSLWRLNGDGGNPLELVKGSALMDFTPDSRWVVYYQHSSEGARLWRVSIDGGDPVQLTFKDNAARPSVSPDGKLIACNYMVTEPNSRFRIAILSIDGGEPIKIFDIPTFPIREIRWTPDGSAVAYISTRDGVSNIWGQPIDGSPARQLTDFKSDFIYSFNWSRDGKQLALSRGPRTSDVVLISDFR
ncbi:MAG TPA: protein kinase [Blastocatellia bacterium]